MMRPVQLLATTLLVGFLWLRPAHAAPEVVVSIKPIHSLIAGVMAGAGTPYLIVKGAASPHGYSLKPSDAHALEKAKLVFWVGEELERFLERSIHSLAKDAQVVWMIDAPDITRLEFREGGAFAGHEEGSAAHSGHAGHDHGMVDMHLWLDPDNAKSMVRYIATSLSEVDAENAAKYSANANALIKKLDGLDRELADMLSPLRDARFIVFHDSYQYFEMRYGLQASGSITVNPDIPPGAKRLRDIRSRVKKLGAACIFGEPQFKSSLVSVIAEGTQARASELDPLGSRLEEGPQLYFTLMRNLARAMKDCLAHG